MMNILVKGYSDFMIITNHLFRSGIPRHSCFTGEYIYDFSDFDSRGTVRGYLDSENTRCGTFYICIWIDKTYFGFFTQILDDYGHFCDEDNWQEFNNNTINEINKYKLKNL